MTLIGQCLVEFMHGEEVASSQNVIAATPFQVVTKPLKRGI